MLEINEFLTHRTTIRRPRIVTGEIGCRLLLSWTLA